MPDQPQIAWSELVVATLLAALLVAGAVIVGVPTLLPWPTRDAPVLLENAVAVQWLQPRHWLSHAALQSASAPDAVTTTEWTLWAHTEMQPTWGKAAPEVMRADILSVRVWRSGSNDGRAVWLPLLWSARARRACHLECAAWPRVSCGAGANITSGRLPPEALELTDNYITAEVERDQIAHNDSTVPSQCMVRAALELGRGYDVEHDWENAKRWYSVAAGTPGAFGHPQERWYARYRLAVATLHDRAEGSNASLSEIENAFLAAIETPGGERRREPYYYLARMWREADAPRRAALYATAGLHLPPLTAADWRYALHVERVLADAAPDASWPLKEELALARYYSGDHASAAALYAELVAQAQSQKFAAHHLRRFRIGLAHAESQQ